jgi:formylglycine-generating enzyme required for sulfatase activity
MLTDKSSRYAVLAAVCAAFLIAASAVRAEDSWPDLSSPPKAIGGGERDAAVIVGAENYLKVEHVPGAKQNANDWQAYLTGTLKVPADRVTLLLDDDATNDAIRQAAVEKAAQVGPDGTLWFVFIGHGAPSKDGKDGLLVGIDAQQKASSVYSRSFSRNELLGILAKGKQAKTVVLIDACFSGKSSSGQALVAGLQPLLTMRALPMGIDSRTILMTAARSDQFAGPLPGGDRPAFSYLALGGLRGWAANAEGQVTASSLVDYIRGALSLSRDRTQTPELSTPETAAVVLGKGREAGPDLAKIQREAASSSGSGFQVTNLPAVPRAEAPQALEASAAGLDFRNLDAAVLDKYNAAFELDKNNDASPEDKAESWRQLAKDVPQYADLGTKRAAAWDAFAAEKKAADEAKQKRIAARDSDWEKLGHFLTLSVIPETDKSAWSGQFVKAYMKSPGLEPVMAKALAAHVAAGPTQEALNKLALKAPTEEGTAVAAAPARATDGKAGIQWVRIPGGTFMMGASDQFNAQPHQVTIKSFQMAKTLVTNKQYKACVAAGACSAAHTDDSSCFIFNGSTWGNANLSDSFQGDDQPVVCVDWNQAKAFSAWAGGRLPTEAEWEYAARSGGKDWKYPWGNADATCANAVIEHCGYNATAPVCSKLAGNTQQGLCDMAGNPKEWVEDWYHDSYNGAPTDGSAWEDPGSIRVTRGGSWYAGGPRSAYRGVRNPDDRTFIVSFRPAR